MATGLRKTGIDVLGDASWGTHFCQFYQTREDLLDVLVPYFRAGLENNEFCLWVTSAPLGKDEATEALRNAVPDFDRYLRTGQIEIRPHTEWYLKDGAFDVQRALDGWVDKLNGALAAGFDGLRLASNTHWLEEADWDGFADYEQQVNNVIGKYRMLAIFSYGLDKYGAAQILDVVNTHQFALIRQAGKWAIIESSERKQAEAAFRRSESRLRSVFESEVIGILFWDANGDITYANDAFLQMVEYSRDEVLSGAVRLRDMTPPEYAHLDEKGMEEIAATGVMAPIEKEYIRKDGSRVPVFMGAASLPGSTPGGVAYVLDITDRKRAEEALRGSTERFRSLIEQVADAMFVIDMEGRILDTNRQACRSLGYTRQELLKLRISNIDTEAVSREHRKRFWQTVTPGQPVTFEGTQKRKDGTIFPVETRLGVLATGPERTLIGMVRDITERKRAEERLRLLSFITEQVSDAVITTNPDYEITYVNQAFRRLYGYSREELLGQSPDVLNAEPNSEQIQNEIYRTVSSGQVWTGEHRNRRKDGTVFLCQMLVFALVDEQGNTFAYTSTQRDVTGRRRAEEKLRENAELYDCVLQSAVDGMVINDEKGQVLDVSESYCRMLGYTREELLKMSVSDFEILETPQETAEHLEKIFEEGFARFESQHKRKDGKVIDVDVSVAPLMRGGVRQFVAFIRDITDRKRTQEEIANLAKFPAESPDPVLRVAGDGNIIFANKAARPLLDAWSCQVDQALPKRWAELVARGLVSGAREDVEIECDGRIFLVTFAPVVENGYVNLYGRDITERRKAEETLRESEERYRTLVQNQGEGIGFVDTEENFTFANPAGHKIFGVPPGGLIGRNLREFVDEETFALIQAQTKVHLAGEKSIYEIDFDRPDGQKCNLLVTATPRFDSEGQFIGTFGIFRDITARKRAEHELDIRNRIAEIFLTVPDEQVYGDVLHVVLEAMDSKYGVFGYIDEAGALVVPSMTRHIWDKCQVPDKKIVYPRETWGNSAWPRAIREKKTLYSNEPSTLTPEGHVPITRNVVVPLIHAGKVIGILHVANKDTDYTREDIALLETIGGAVAPVLNARLQRDRADQALRESTERFRTLIDQAADAMFAIDMEGRILDTNRQASRSLGYTREELLQMRISDVDTEVVSDEHRKRIWEKLTPGQSVTFEGTHKRKDGTTFPVEVRIGVLDAGAERTVIGLARDVTERKQAAEGSAGKFVDS